jgi:hypothetical protein
MHCDQENLEMQKELVFAGIKVLLYPVCHLVRIPNKTVF